MSQPPGATNCRSIDLRSGPVDWEIRVATERLVAECRPRPSPPIADLAAAVTRAIEQPLDFPPLAQAIYEGDRVVIAVDGSPWAYRAVLLPLIELARRRGARADAITVVAPWRAREVAHRLGSFPARVLFHNPDDQQQLSYLASTEEGERIYLNRTVVDADVLILVGTVRYDPVLGYRGTASAVFPALSTRDSFRRFVSSFTGRRVGHHPKWARNYVDQVGWLLGAQFSVQLVQGPGGSIVAVLAGNAAKVQEAAQQKLDELLSFRVPRQADLVLATLGRGGRQSAAELARAAFTAQRVVRKGGRIALLSAVEQIDGPTMERVRKADEIDEVLGFLRNETPPDAVTGFMHATACQRARVFLHSGLADELVEELFMFPLHTQQQLQRLVDQAASVIVLHEANCLQVTVQD